MNLSTQILFYFNIMDSQSSNVWITYSMITGNLTYNYFRRKCFMLQTISFTKMYIKMYLYKLSKIAYMYVFPKQNQNKNNKKEIQWSVNYVFQCLSVYHAEDCVQSLIHITVAFLYGFKIWIYHPPNTHVKSCAQYSELCEQYRKLWRRASSIYCALFYKFWARVSKLCTKDIKMRAQESKSWEQN